MYKVFIRSSVLYISSKPVKLVKGLKDVENIKFQDSGTFSSLIENISASSAVKSFCVHGKDLVYMWKKFRKQFTPITAAGGLVRNPENRILFIFRNDRWDLPKGKVEKSESIPEAAIREVKEECGIRELKIIKPLLATYHTYGTEAGNKLKKTFWFEMYSDDRELTPQVEEGITKIKWVKGEKLKKIFENTYPSIVDVVQADLTDLSTFGNLTREQFPDLS